MSEYQAKPHSFSERLGLKIHLLLCGFCRRYLAQVSHLRSAVEGTDPSMDPDVTLPAAARNRMKQCLLHAHDHEPGDNAPEPPPPHP